MACPETEGNLLPLLSGHPILPSVGDMEIRALGSTNEIDCVLTTSPRVARQLVPTPKVSFIWLRVSYSGRDTELEDWGVDLPTCLPNIQALSWYKEHF